jgi:hypothetical protein
VLDLYCERLGSGLAAEPLNALSNLFFVAAALLLLPAARRAPTRTAAALTLALLAIGVGSGLFHTYATRWAEWLDVLPILFFQLVYLGAYLHQLCTLSVRWSGALVALFALSLGGAAMFPAVINGSLAYAPAAAVLFWMGVDYALREGSMNVFVTAGVFLVSLIARSLDNALCAWWPYGTHFVWHILNAIVLYRLVCDYLRSLRLARHLAAET